MTGVGLWERRIPMREKKKNLVTLLNLCVSSLRRAHSSLLCIFSILLRGTPEGGQRGAGPLRLAKCPLAFYNCSKPFGFQLCLTRPVNSSTPDVKRTTISLPIWCVSRCPRYSDPSEKSQDEHGMERNMVTPPTHHVACVGMHWGSLFERCIADIDAGQLLST